MCVIKRKFPNLLISVLFGIGLILNFAFNQEWGVVIMIISFLVALVSLTQPKQYGLKIDLNSGDKKIFITSDKKWLDKAVSRLYDFMEKAPEGSSMTIKIGGNIQGNIIQGSNVEGRNH